MLRFFRSNSGRLESPTKRMKTPSDSLGAFACKMNQIKCAVRQACNTIGLPPPYRTILEDHYLEILEKYKGEVLYDDRNRPYRSADGWRSFLNKCDSGCLLFRALYYNYFVYPAYRYFDYPSFARTVLGNSQAVEVIGQLSKIPGCSRIKDTLATVQTFISDVEPCSFAQCQILKPIMHLAIAWGKCRKRLFDENSKLSGENAAIYELSATELADFQGATYFWPKPHHDNPPCVSERAPMARNNLTSRPLIPFPVQRQDQFPPAVPGQFMRPSPAKPRIS